MTECNEGIGDEARLRRVGIVLGMTVRDAAEIFESLEIVLRNAVAFGVHAAELPLRERVAFFSGVFERVDRFDGFAGLEPMRARAERLDRGHRRGRHAALGFAAVERECGRRGHQAGTDQHHTQQGLKCPHNTLSQPRRRDA